MDKKLLEEIISDLENVSRIVNSRLEQLYSLLGKSYDKDNSVNSSIQKQRKSVADEINKIRSEVMSRVNDNILQVKDLNMTSGMGAQNFGMNRSSFLGDINSMKQEIMSKINANKIKDEK